MRSTFIYTLFRGWVKIGLKIYFRSIEVVGQEKVPQNRPVLFAVNHPNTVLDALLVGCTNPRHSYFLARGDVFKSKIAKRIFTTFRMMPVFRQRDGVAMVKENNSSFDFCSEVLIKGGSLIMFPEGSHNRDWRIRDLRKGLARIAYAAFLKNPDLVVIPVGLNYFDPKYSFSDVLIKYGDPIELGQYFKEPVEDLHQVVLFNNLMKRLTKELITLTLHIDGNYNDIYTRVKNIESAREESDTLVEDFIATQNAIEACQNDPELGLIKEPSIQETVRNKILPLLALIFTAPLWLVGKCLTLIPQLVIFYSIKKLKDDHFTGSVKFIIGLVLYTILIIGIGFWSYATTLTTFWFITKWLMLSSSMLFVMLWEQHLDKLFNLRFVRS